MRNWHPPHCVGDSTTTTIQGGRTGGAVYDPTPVVDSTGAVRVIFSYCPSRYMHRPPIPQAFELWEVVSKVRLRAPCTLFVVSLDSRSLEVMSVQMELCCTATTA
jgi:hypothetical protein